jgi:hypothetical protein
MPLCVLWASVLGLACSGEEPSQGTMTAPTAPIPALVTDIQALAPMPPDAVVSARLTQDNGFRNASMGRDRKAFEDLQRRKNWDDKALGLRAYAKKGEYLLVGAATVERIVYRFLDDQLFSVEVLSEDLLHCSTLKNVFTEMYGEGRRSETGFDQLVWWGDDVTLIFTSMGDCSAEYTWRSKHREQVVGALPDVTAEQAPPPPAETDTPG